MRILFVASEVSPWVKTGGLADVVGALPRALARVGGPDLEVATLVPLYRQVRERALREGVTLEDTGVVVQTHLDGRDETGRVLRAPGEPPLFFVEHDRYYDRQGVYVNLAGHDHADNAFRFAFLSQAALGAERFMGGPPDIVHCHDWQTGLLPVYLRHTEGVSRVLTIHNLAYQGWFGKDLLPRLGLDWSLFTWDQLEFYDQLNFLKAGISFSDAVSTVSPTYAEEIQTPGFGQALDAHLRVYAETHPLVGILNGLDEVEWDPRTDPHLPAGFDADDLTGKARCRAALLEEVGLPPGPQPLLGVVSRFAGQKGLDLVAALGEQIWEIDARLVVLGTGDPHLEGWFRGLSADQGDRVATRVEFDNGIAHRIVAGSDMLLVPSRFEPCGLTQLQAMAYGTVPVVHAVGGLKDTVRDPGDEALAHGEGTGFRFEGASLQGLRWAVERAVGLFRNDPEGWSRLVRACMRRDSSWDTSAAQYLQLYENLRGGT